MATISPGAAVPLPALPSRWELAAEAVAVKMRWFGLIVGYLYLKGPRNPWADVQYQYLRWRYNRARKRFNVHRGGRGDDWNGPVH